MTKVKDYLDPQTQKSFDKLLLDRRATAISNLRCHRDCVNTIENLYILIDDLSNLSFSLTAEIGILRAELDGKKALI